MGHRKRYSLNEMVLGPGLQGLPEGIENSAEKLKRIPTCLKDEEENTPEKKCIHPGEENH